MKKIFLYFLLSLSFLSPTYADFQDGVDAYNNKQYKKALKEFKPLAEKGNAKAQSYLGYFYSQGFGVWPNVDKSFSWFEKAANQGDARSQYAMGVFYSEGESVPQNDIKALEWLKKSSNQGFSRADKEIKLIETRIGKTSTIQTSDNKQAIPENSYTTPYGWTCKFGYYQYQNNNFCSRLPANSIGIEFGDGFSCLKGYVKRGKSCGKKVKVKVEVTLLTTNIPNLEEEVLLINKANLSGQKKYNTTSLENLSCKSSLIVTKGGALNITKKESITTNNLVSSYSQGFTEVTNQRYFELQSKIRQAKYDLQDVKDLDTEAYNALTAVLSVVLKGTRQSQIKDEIQALENELRNTSTTTRTQNKAPYNITQDSVVWEKTQQAKWMLVNCITGEVEINELNASDILKINFYKGLRSDDINSFASSNIKAKNKLKNWSKQSILSLYNTNKLDNKLLSKSSTEIDTASLVSLVETFLSTQ